VVWSHATTDIDKARLLAASSPHSGDWLAAPPITAVGLRLTDEEIRVAVAHRLGCKACEPHTCGCGKAVDARGLHGLACKRCAPRQQRHSHLKDIIWRAMMKRAHISAVKEPVGLMRQDSKRPDGTTILPWSRGKPLAWDETVPDTYADAHVANTARKAGAAANHTLANKNTKYSQLSSIHIFFPVAIETAGTWHYQAVELIQEVGRRTTNITGDHLPVPAAVHCTTEGKCGLIPKHIHYQLACCNSLFSSFPNVFVPTVFIPAEKNNNNMTIYKAP